jgi:hypothetical protein
VFDLIRQNPRTALAVLLLPALVTVVYLALVVRLTLIENDGYIGALLDDTWIHIRFAASIADGRGLMFNDGVITPGATSPLWVLLLGAVFALTNPGLNGQVQTAVALSAAGNVLAVLAVGGFGWTLTRRAWIGLLAALITALTGRFIWMGLSGMEITTFTALCLFAVWSHVHDRRENRGFGWRTGILLALATLARPEGYLLAALILLDAFILAPGGLWGRVRAVWRGAVAYGLLAGSYPLACLLMAGHPLPNTFRAKSQLGQSWPDLPYSFFWTPNADHGPLLIVLVALGIGFLLWRVFTRRDDAGYAWILWPSLFVLAVLFMGPDRYVVNNARYVAPVIPFHALMAAVGLWALAEFAKNRFPAVPPRLKTTIIPAALGVVLVATALWLGRGHGWQVANDVGQLRRMHITAAEWFNANTAPDELIALNDVGVIAHFTNRPVLDMLGLVSPQVTAALEDVPPSDSFCPRDLQIARVIADQQPVLIVVFPWLFPCLTAWEGALQPYTVFTITGPTVIAGGEMVVYWPVWENWPVQRDLPPDAAPLNADFEQGIRLAGYEAAPVDGGLQVILWWQAQRTPDADLTVFAHLTDERGSLISQHDSRPQHEQFNTRWWRAGDLIRDARLIQLDDPAALQRDDLQLRIGLYPTGGGPRLPRLTAPIGQDDYALIPLDRLR